MISKIKRRMRCEVQGCHSIALYGLGIRGNDYPMCEKHFGLLKAEIYAIDGNVNNTEKTITEAQNKPQNEDDDKPYVEEYFTCRFCGKKFDKKDYTIREFTHHSQLCAREHKKCL